MKPKTLLLVHGAGSGPWVFGGWSSTVSRRPEALVLLEPSPSGEVQGFDETVVLDTGTFDPEQTYGVFPAGMRSRAESVLARAERKRGISVPELPFPTLVVSGRAFPEERGTRVADWYRAELISFPDVSHWGLVRGPRVRREIVRFIARI